MDECKQNLPLDLVERFLTHKEEVLLWFLEVSELGEALLLSTSLSSSLLLTLLELPDWVGL
jgi:hypothetical protein